MRFLAKPPIVLVLAEIAAPFVNAEFFNTPTNGTQVVIGSYFNVTWDLDVVNALFSGANATNATSSETDGAQPTNTTGMRRWVKFGRRQEANNTNVSDASTSSTTSSGTDTGVGLTNGTAMSGGTGTSSGAGAMPTAGSGMNTTGTFSQCVRGIPAVLNGTVPVCSILQMIHVGHNCTPAHAVFSTINLDVTAGWLSFLVPYASNADQYAIELIFQDGASESDFVSPPFSLLGNAPSS